MKTAEEMFKEYQGTVSGGYKADILIKDAFLAGCKAASNELMLDKHGNYYRIRQPCGCYTMFCNVHNKKFDGPAAPAPVTACNRYLGVGRHGSDKGDEYYCVSDAGHKGGCSTLRPREPIVDFTQNEKYGVAHADVLPTLVAAVARMSRCGWVTIGGVNVCRYDDDQMFFYQAMEMR